ncbi:putative arsenic methyltransferase Cyt19 [Gautieria morchelliformis]|nr:putative arsenic methyltransferase Cyt19 [Gautieria morchelliformis]
MDFTALTEAVHERYSDVARQNVSDKYARDVANSFGYTKDALDAIPEGANMGLSCGNPVAAASLRPGEVVVDLGSGGGLDVFLAAKAVGPNGSAIGLDFSQDMISLARKNKERQGGFDNVRFEHTSITKLPLADNSVDCVTSNCVINLVPDAQKPDVITEIFRVLKPGGRVSISDIVAHQPLPDQVRQDIASYIGCVSGAAELSQYREMFHRAGFPDAVFVDTKKDLDVYSKCAAPQTASCCGVSKPIGGMSTRLEYDVNQYVGSFQIYALKSNVTL